MRVLTDGQFYTTIHTEEIKGIKATFDSIQFISSGKTVELTNPLKGQIPVYYTVSSKNRYADMWGFEFGFDLRSNGKLIATIASDEVGELIEFDKVQDIIKYLKLDLKEWTIHTEELFYNMEHDLCDFGDDY